MTTNQADRAAVPADRAAALADRAAALMAGDTGPVLPLARLARMLREPADRLAAAVADDDRFRLLARAAPVAPGLHWPAVAVGAYRAAFEAAGLAADRLVVLTGRPADTSTTPPPPSRPPAGARRPPRRPSWRPPRAP